MAMAGPQKTAATLVGVVVLMGGLAWASVPFYNWFCRVTGFGGTTNVAEQGTDEILDKTIKVRFDASIDRGMPWTFKPVERVMEVRIGETGLAFFEAHNPTDHPVAGQASYNVFPYEAGYFFNKIACFCFDEQVLEPGETVQMPVLFFVDPLIDEESRLDDVHTMTLSYTFFESEGDAASADAAP